MKKPMKCVLGGLALLWAASTPAARQQDAVLQTKVIHAGKLIDGTSTAVRERVSILIAGDRIVDVQAGFVRPAGAQVIDLSRGTVMPGLIDSHTHITGEGTSDAILKAVTLSAVDGDPVRDITEMQRVRFVMKGGVVHRDAARATPPGSGRQ